MFKRSKEVDERECFLFASGFYWQSHAERAQAFIKAMIDSRGPERHD
jgi:hypothetical protein